FIALVERHGIAWHEKTLGQLFCDGSARQIVDLFLDEMRQAGVELRLGAPVSEISRDGEDFRLNVAGEAVACRSLVVASGGKSIPKMGATGFGYEVARRFGLKVTETRPALAPLTFEGATLERMKALAGVSVDARVASGRTRFSEAMLFTHRGLSGPAILQISSYWREGGEIEIDMAPGVDVYEALKAAKAANGRQGLAAALAERLPRRLAQSLVDGEGFSGNLADAPDKLLRRVGQGVNAWRLKPVGSEGYRTAEVTLGGVDTDELDSRTMAAKQVPGLYF